MKTLYKSILVAAAGLMMSPLMAQGTKDTIGPNSVTVYTNTTPIVQDAVKVMYPAEIPKYEREKTVLKYEMPSRQAEVAYEPVTIRPLGLSKEKPMDFPSSYVKLGFGTQFSPFLEAMHNGRKVVKDQEKLSYGVYLKHHSAYGQKINFQDFSENRIAAYGSVFLNKVRVNTKLEYRRDGRFYYGMDIPDSLDIKKKDVRQVFNQFNATIELLNTKISDSHFDHSTLINFYHFSDKFDQSEFGIIASAKLQKAFGVKHFVSLRLDEDYTGFKSPTYTKNRNLFMFRPTYEFNDLTNKIIGGVGFAYEDKTFHVLPHLSFERPLYKQFLVMYNGWKMELRRLGYRELAMTNPWMQPGSFELKHTRYEERLIAGFKGTAGKFSYDASIRQIVLRRAPLFINDPNDMGKFDVLYARGRLNIMKPMVELAYRVNSNLDFTLFGEYNQYEVEVEARAWHMPRWYASFTTRLKVGDKLFLNARVYAIDGVFAKLADGSELKLKGTVDVNLGATYKFSKSFSFFANFNNIAHMKYQPYYNYPTYGFNCMAGVIFTYN
ncbi:hypothetical protein BH09BAC1_BH09BAC1_18910 [soil metagenome]